MKRFIKKEKQARENVRKNQIALKGGSYSLMLTGIVLAILIAVNVFASVLPSAWTKLDISSMKLYSITSNTKVVVNALEKDVIIYWVVQADQEDSIIENLLAKYESLSDHIEVVKKNPDVYPTFTQQYTSETVPNNSLIVECGDSNRYISYEDIYLTETDMTTYSYTQSFDGEGAITSAIDYVVSEDHPQLYITEGHGESDLSAVFEEQIEKENIETTTFTLLNEDTVPEEADVVLIYAPASDISEEEKNMLVEYVENGGKLMVLAGPVEDGELTNLCSLLENYGVKAEEGIVVEGSRDYYAFQQPYILLPEIAEHEITTPLLEASYYVIMPLAQGLTVTDTTGAVTQLLTTSEASFSKIAGYAIETYEKEENDIDGPFATAVSIECGNEGQIVWFSSAYFLDEMYNSYSSGANLDLSMNALSSMIGEREAVAIRSKSLNYSYLTINESTAFYLKVMMIGAIPLAFLGYGINVIVSRRRRQNETV